jgi:long-subunit fatty acid transport protein
MKKTFLTIAIGLAATGVLATANAAGTASAQFLKLGAGARAAAMGEAFTAVSDDVTATYWNPAGLTQLRAAEAELMHNAGLVNTQYQFLAGAMPTQGDWTFGASLYRMDYGSMDRYDNADVKDGSFQAGSLAVGFSAARKWSDNLSVGLTGKVIREGIDDVTATGAAADAGAMYRFDNYQFGAALQNVGPALKFVTDSSPLPATLRLGAAGRFLDEKLLLGLDLTKARDTDPSVSAGAEYSPAPQLKVRGGYKSSTGAADLGGLAGISAGAGFSIRNVTIDYAFVPFGDLGATHRISLQFRMNADAPLK